MGNWSSTTPGGVTCSFSAGYTFQDPSGGRHNLHLGTTSYANPGNYLCGSAYVSGGDEKYAAWLLNDANGGTVYPPVLVSDADGTVYYFSTPYRYLFGTGLSSPPDYIEDRNGNKITISSQSTGAFTVTDTTGRAAITSNGRGGSGTTNTLSASGMNYKVNWTSATPNFSFPHEMLYNVDGYLCQWSSATAAETVVNTITLPNNKNYTFKYGTNPNAPNSYGLLSEIDYPTGEWVRYTWKMSDTYSQAITFLAIAGPGGSTFPGGCIALVQTPVVATRSIGHAGSATADQIQTFTYNTVWNSAAWTSKTTTVSTEDVVRGVTAKTIYTYGPGNAGNNNPYLYYSWIASQLPLETSIEYYDFGAIFPFRTVNKTWADNFDLASQETVLYDGGTQPSQITYSYTGGILSQLTNKSEYDYGLTLLRSTTTKYQPFATTPLGGLIADKPCQTIIYDGNNNKFAETDYLYDNGAVLCGTPSTSSETVVNGLVTGTHDEANYGPTSTAVRGNLTNKTRWGSVGGSPITTYTYDETGQVLSMTDPCGIGSCSDMTGSAHTTLFYYADNYTVLSAGTNVGYTPGGATNTYLTKVTDALGYFDTFSYDYNNGQLTNSADLNRKSTGYIYNDSLARPTQLSYPDGGQTALAYNDSPYNPSIPSAPSVTSTKLITSQQSEVSTASFDGLGNTIETTLSSDPDGATYSATTYDGLGHPYKVYNPTRCSTPTSNCGESTGGVTMYQYDALGRLTLIQRPDLFSWVTYAYGANQAAITDEAGNERTTQTDGLGRLTGVWEAPNVSGYNYQTHYQYDPLNNLTCAVQQGTDTTAFTACGTAPASWRPRSFSYDSLSHLTSATNPESGTITYSYDLNGNMASKVAPKPGQTGTLKGTTNYSYDALNRLTQKAYVNLATASVKFGYDGGTAPTCGQNPPTIASPTNLVGRMSTMCAAYSGSSWSYDPMGRPLLESRTNGGGGSQPKYSVGYFYNLDGSLAKLTYPSGNVLTYNIGGAGRPVSATDSANSYVSSGTYAPQGSLAGMINGYTSSFAGIVTANTYNDRLQPLTRSASAGTSPIFNLCYFFGATQNLPFPCNNATSNNDNGNLYTIQNLLNSWDDIWYSYDPLNRLSTAGISSGSDCWQEVYTIDAWGNLTNIAPPINPIWICPNENLNAPALANNQLTGFSYDAAGNIIHDVSNAYTYDGENRILTAAGWTYSYDADGERMEKSSGSSGTKYWFGPAGILTESSLTGTINEEYIYFNGERIARVDRPSGAVHYYFPDHLSSATFITDAVGNVQEQYRYYPFGGLISSVGSDPNKYKFNGKERDLESNLDEFGARYYTSALGRFMTPDWADEPTAVPYANFGNPQSLNLYSFVENNPMTTGDPDGHCVGDGDGNTECGMSLPYTSGTMALEGADTRTIQPNLLANKWWQKLKNLFSCDDNCGPSYANTLPWPALKRVEWTIAAGARTAVVGGLLAGYLVSPPGQFAKDTIGPNKTPNPPSDPKQSPGKGWEWRGKGAPGSAEGSWYNPGTGESLHPDLNHPDPIGPHWDYRDPSGNDWRIYPDGNASPK
jgi:RHS repeat-associated protein